MAKRIINLARKYWYTFFFVVLCIFVMVLTIRGNGGNPTEDELNTSFWKEEGPLELSPERGRFTLIYSLIENKSFQFSENLARFASPDVAVTKDGKYASLFAPTLSFLIAPGFVLGKLFNISQIGAYFIISLFAIANVLLIRKIALIWGVSNLPATLAGSTFLFATPAFAYGVNLYQHHVSTFLILLSIYLLLEFRGFLSLFLIFLFCSLSLTLDYPNLFMMFPIGIVALTKIFSVEKLRNRLNFSLNFQFLPSAISVIFPILFLLWFNAQSYGNPFQLSGTLQTIKNMDKNKADNESFQGIQPALEETLKDRKTAIGFFETRNLTNGLYLHFLSPDRGMIFYAPNMLFGIFGIVIAIRKRLPLSALLISIIGINILLYSMWGDPWGGWAFGSRYLIPTYALLSIFIALTLFNSGKKILLTFIFSLILPYSIFVNTLGTLTSSANPPQIEVLSIEKLSGREEKYTFFRNLDYLLAGSSKSFIFRSFAKNYLDSVRYYILVFALIISVNLMLLLLDYLIYKREK